MTSPSAPGIVLVSGELAPWTAGGIGRLVSELGPRLADASWSVRLLLDLPTPTVRRVRAHARTHWPGLEAWGVEELAPGGLPDHAFPCRPYARSQRIWRALESLASREPLDVVELPDYEGLAFVPIKARRLGMASPALERARVAVRIHGTAERWARADDRFQYAPAILQTFAMERYALRHADVVLSPSPGVTAWIRQDTTLPPEPRVLYSTPPVVRRAERRAHRPPPRDGALVVLFVGKLQPVKGVSELLAAAIARLRARGPDCLVLRLVGGDTPTGPGGGSFRAELEASIPTDLRHAVRFYGHLSQAELDAMPDACHVAVLPSRSESFCLAAHELRSAGMPLLLSDIPAFQDHFREDPGVRFFDGTRAHLERRLDELLDAAEIPAPPPPKPKTAPATDAYAGILEIEQGDGEPASSTPHPVVSVVVPYYEMPETVEEAVRSVESSEGAKWELILVDDGSPSEDARRAVDRLAAERQDDPRFRLLRKANGGLSSARNAGIDAARGDYVLPLDADDRLDPRYLAIAVRALARRPELGFVSCTAARFAGGDASSRPVEWIVPVDPDPARLLYENGAGVAACVFRRSVFEKIRYDESLPAYEDWDLHLGLARAGVRGECLPDVLVHYRVQHRGMAATLAHPQHDRLLGRMLDKHHPDAPAEIRDALKIHIHESSRLRGLGSGGPPPLSGWRATTFSTLRGIYLRYGKATALSWLPEDRLQRWALSVRRWLERPPDR